MYCSNCGNQVPDNSNFCVKCGQNLADGSVVQGGAFAAAAVTYGRRYSLWRVGLLTLVTFGIYFIYWYGVTWKQMGTQSTGREHYPLMHVLSLLVPFYGFYVVHTHFGAIMSMQRKVGVRSSLISPLPLIIFIVGLSVAPLVDELLLGPELGVLSLVYLPALVGLVLWGQANLNRYWRQVDGESRRSPKFGPGEITTPVLGGAIGGLVIIGLVMGPSPSIYSIYEGRPATDLVVGQTASGSITDLFEVDVFAFQPERGRRYLIQTDRGRSDSVGDTLIALWDQDGETVIQAVDDNTTQAGEQIEWTAPDSGTFYISVEHPVFGKGSYTVVVMPVD